MNPPHFIHEINTIAYDVSDVNVFLRTLMRFLRKNKDNSVPPILLSGYTGVRLILGLRRKDWILRALLLPVRTLWPHKVGSRVEIYSIR